MKKIKRVIKLLVPAQNAKVEPPLGPIFGQLGLKALDFCKAFNEDSKLIKKNTILRVFLFLYVDNSCEYYISRPTVSYLLAEACLEETQSVNFVDLYKICILTSNISIMNNHVKSIISVANACGITIK